MDIAGRSGANTLSARKRWGNAVDAFNVKDLNLAFKEIVETKAELSQAIRKLGMRSDTQWYPRPWRWLIVYWKVILPMNGFWPLSIATVSLAAYVYLLIFWSHAKQSIAVRFGALQPLGVPAWAGLFAGLGASIQIVVSVVSDLSTDGYVTRHRRVWYQMLPLVAPVFGFIAYILVALGFLSFSAPQPSGLLTGKESFAPILATFLAGYSTEWVMGKLKALAS